MSRTTQTAAFIEQAYEGIQAAQEREPHTLTVDIRDGGKPITLTTPPYIFGRPTTYTPTLAARIIEQLRLGHTPTEIAAEDWSPALAIFYKWLDIHPDFKEGVARARAAGAAVMVDRAIDIADTADESTKTGIQKARLRADIRLRVAATYDRRFSDRQIITHESDASQATALPTESLALIAQELARLLQDRKAIDVESVALDAEPDQHRIDTKP